MSRDRWTRATLAAGVAVAIALAAYAAGRGPLGPGTTSAPGAMQAQRSELVDAQGKVRGVLGTKDGRPSLSLMDTNGNSRAVLLLAEGEGQTARVSLSVSQDGRPLVVVSDNEGNLRASYCILFDGRTSIDIWPSAGAPVEGLK